MALPATALKHILTFVDGSYTTAMYPQRPWLPMELFDTLRSVGDAWRPALDELQCEFQAAVLEIQLSYALIEQPSDSDAVEAWLLAHLQHHGHSLQCLELGLEMLEQRRNYEVVSARSLAEAFDCKTVVIDWMQVFRLCPKLQRLDLSGLPLRSSHLPRILDAASTHCANIKSLVLPGKEWYRGPVGIETQWLFRMLYTAMQRWHRGGGLQQLTVPQRISYPDETVSKQALADEFLYAVAVFCPQLQYLDGYKASVQEFEGVLRCDDRIECSVAVWELFCRSCTHLRELHWAVFPSSDVFFDRFATSPKPQLTKLTLVSYTNGQLTTARPFSQRAVGSQPAVGHSALTVSPALRELTILLQDELRDHATHGGPLPTERIVRDALLAAIAEHCPLLSRLEIRHVGHSGGAESMLLNDDGAADGMSDHGMALLATLPHLASLQLNVSSSVGARGLFSLIASAPTTGALREIEAVVGCDGMESLFTTRTESSPFAVATSTQKSQSFHNVLLTLVDLVAVHREQLRGRRFQLTLHNGSSLYTDHQDDWQSQMEASVA